MDKQLILGYFYFCIICITGAFYITGASAVQLKEGRLKQFDEVIRLHVDEMHRNDEIHIAHIVDLVKTVRIAFRGTPRGKAYADYYVKIFIMVHDAGTMGVLHDEHARIERIIEQGYGPDSEYAEEYKSILDSFYEIAGEHLMAQLDAENEMDWDDQLQGINLPTKLPEGSKWSQVTQDQLEGIMEDGKIPTIKDLKKAKKKQKSNTGADTSSSHMHHGHSHGHEEL